MTAKELIDKLKQMPQDKEIAGMFTDVFYDYEIDKICFF